VQYLQFDGTSSYFEVPNSPLFSVDTSGALTVAAWMRPDTLTFPVTEGSCYVHWVGKGQGHEQEWTFECTARTTRKGGRIALAFTSSIALVAVGLGVTSRTPSRRVNGSTSWV